MPDPYLGTRHSWVRDLVNRDVRQDEAAGERLRASNTYVHNRAQSEQRALSSTLGYGGSFQPPHYLLERFADVPRAGRPLADAIAGASGGVQEIAPGSGMSLEIPKILTGLDASSVAENTASSSPTYVDEYVSAPVCTVVSSIPVSLQFVERAASDVVDTLFALALRDALDASEDAQIAAGSGPSAGGNQLSGLIPNAGVTVTFTQASPTVAELQTAVTQAASQGARARKRPLTHVAMTPTRWEWVAEIAEVGLGGPKMTPGVPGCTVGPFAGKPVVQAASIPANYGTGTNQDAVIVFRPADSLLFERTVEIQALLDTNAGAEDLTVYLVARRYVSMLTKYPEAVAVVSGTGLVMPSGY